MKPRLTLDAADNIFFQRELEQISAEMFDVKYAQLKGRLFVPVDNSVDPGAETWTYTQYDSLGKAQKIADFAADLPQAGVNGLQFSQRLQSYGSSFGYSLDEIFHARYANKPLDRMRAMACRKSLDQKLDALIANGDSAANLIGFLGLSGVLTKTLGTKTAGGLTWAVATPTEILADMNGMIDKVITTTLDVEHPTRLLMPVAQFRQISTTARSTTSDTTILAYFKANNPGVEVFSWELLSTAGAGSTTRMVAYDPNPLNLRLLMSVEFEQQPPQERNYARIINCRFKTGGVVSPFPQSICYADGA